MRDRKLLLGVLPGALFAVNVLARADQPLRAGG